MRHTETVVEDNLSAIGVINWKKIFLLICIIIGSLLISPRNYLLFHNSIEIFSIVIAFNIFIISINTQNMCKRNFLTFIGVAYGFVGFFDIFHVMTYNGMGIFLGDTTNLATEFWIVARYIESISLALSFLFLKKQENILKTFSYYMVFAVLIMLSIFVWDTFPDCYVPGEGLTTFKIVSEYVIVLIFIISIVALIKSRKNISRNKYIIILHSLVFSILSDIMFTLYLNVYDLSNVFGHIFKLISFYLIYKGLCEYNLKLPYRLLSEAKKSLEIKADELEKANEQLVIENNERKLVEAALRLSERRYKEFLDLFPDAIVVYNDFRYFYVNKAALRIFGVEDERDIVGRDIFDFIDENYHNEIKEKVNKRLKGEDIKTHFEHRIKSISGEIIDVETIYSTIYLNEEKMILSVINDITERKENERLQNEIRLKEELLIREKEYERMKSDFFVNLSHELKTPLNIILGAVQLFEQYLKEESVSTLNEKMIKYINTMKQNSFRLLRIVNNLVDVNKIEAGYLTLQLGNHNIVNIVENIALSVAGYVENKGIGLVFDTDVEEKIIACDPDTIERIILNLLSNAVKFTNPGGKISVNIFNKENLLGIEVKDTGVGIPEDKLSDIFERFKQVDKTLVRNQQGSGIGLALVNALVELHGGSIHLESKEGVGSKFTILIPAKLINEHNTIETYEDQPRETNIERINIEFSDIYS